MLFIRIINGSLFKESWVELDEEVCIVHQLIYVLFTYYY